MNDSPKTPPASSPEGNSGRLGRPGAGPRAAAEPRVGVGVIVVRDGRVLVGHRIGSHGAGTWALPGGHLEFGETVEACARREVLEETGLHLSEVRPAPYANDVFDEPPRLFVVAEAAAGEPRVLEPAKCTEWRWVAWSQVPEPLFAPLQTLIQSGFVPAGAG